MSQSDNRLWRERIARALAELKKGLPADIAAANGSGDSRDPREAPRVPRSER